MAPSGGGKTYSSLRVATGMAEEMKKQTSKDIKILLANTEQKRGYYYANEFNYDIVDVDAPHNPEKYVVLIDFAVSEGYDILILDSSSHEWEGKGGCLELHQQAGGTYQSWGKVTPRHNKFIEAIADSPIHLIATMRGKDQYEMEKDSSSGKTNVKKLGVGAKQREGFEYEFTCTFLLDQKTNMAEVQKDNTHLFEHEGATLLSETHGKKLIQWANSGEGYTPPVRKENTEQEKEPTTEERLANGIKMIDELAKKLTESGLDKKVIGDTIKANFKHKDKPSANYNAIQDVETATNVYKALKKLEVK
jgi:hypothetical protein